MDFLNDKIYIDSDKHEIYKQLSGSDAPFETMKDVFLIAATLGFSENTREPLKSKKDIFSKQQFSTIESTLIYSLAIAYTKEGNSIYENPLSLVEELANGGIRELELLVRDGNRTSVSRLVEKVLLEYA